MDLEQRRITRLIVEAPPRHGKSQLCSVFFPAWYLGRHPDHNVMIASEEMSLATEFSEKIRDTLQMFGPEVYGVAVHKRRTNVESWRIADHAGRVMTSGIKTGGMTGRGANLLIVDDPIRSSISAMSDNYREKVWDWFISTASTRMQPGGIILIIMTRWHQDDLVGRLLKNDTDGTWTRVHLPALAKEHDELGRALNEPLWPERMDRDYFLPYQKSEYWWNALYQQEPAPAGGTIAKGTWFELRDSVPPNVLRCRFWDCASTEETQKSDPDYTVGVLMARNIENGEFFIEHIHRVRRGPHDVDQLIRQTAEVDGPEVAIREEEEGGSAGKAVTAERKRKLVGYNYDGVRAHKAKYVRWMPLLIQAEARNIRLIKGPWVQPFLDEVNAVPYGVHDDQMDAAAGAFTELAAMEENAVTGFTW